MDHKFRVHSALCLLAALASFLFFPKTPLTCLVFPEVVDFLVNIKAVDELDILDDDLADELDISDNYPSDGPDCTDLDSILQSR